MNSTRLIKSFECPIKNYFERTLCQSNISTLTAALCVSVCLSVRIFLPLRACRSQNLGTNWFTTMEEKNFYNHVFLLKMLCSKLQRHLLASDATNYIYTPKDGYQFRQRNQRMLISEVMVHLLTVLCSLYAILPHERHVILKASARMHVRI